MLHVIDGAGLLQSRGGAAPSPARGGLALAGPGLAGRAPLHEPADDLRQARDDEPIPTSTASTVTEVVGTATTTIPATSR